MFSYIYSFIPMNIDQAPHYVPGTVLAGGDMTMNKGMEVPALVGLPFQQISKPTL